MFFNDFRYIFNRIIKIEDKKFLHFKNNNIQIFYFLLVLFVTFDAFFHLSYSNDKKTIHRIIKNQIINTEEYSVPLSDSNKKNIYIF